MRLLSAVVFSLACVLALAACGAGRAPSLATVHQHEPSERCIGID